MKSCEWAIKYETDPGKTLLDLQCSLSADAKREWEVGGLPSLHGPAVLLTFMQQLAKQGWTFAERLPCESEKISQTKLRELRKLDTLARTSCGRGLDEQQPDEFTDPVHILSSILARHASEAWVAPYETYASAGFPLRHGVTSRMGKLRAYGNALDAETAIAFCETVAEIVGIRSIAGYDL